MDSFERLILFLCTVLLLMLLHKTLETRFDHLEAQLNTIQMQTAHAEFFTQPIPHKQSDIKLMEK